MLKRVSLFILSFSVILFLPSCDKDDPVIPNEEEIITTLNYILTPSDNGMPVIFSFQDLDGDGGNPPIVSGGTLEVNQTYTAVLELFNEQEMPAEDIAAEVLEEGEEHQVFFQTNVTGLEISYNDQDANNRPIGLQTNVETGVPGNGTLTIILRHEPDKSAAGVSGGDPANAGGETDIEVTFDVSIQ